MSDGGAGVNSCSQILSARLRVRRPSSEQSICRMAELTSIALIVLVLFNRIDCVLLRGGNRFASSQIGPERG
jgi:hypothetical protein